jgi:repressor LexA
MEMISDRQRQIVDFISWHIAQHNRPPTNREIGRAIGASSASLVDFHLARLAKKGFIQREAHVSRGLKLTPAAQPAPRMRLHQIPVQGYIAAGGPIVAITDPNDTIELSVDLATDNAYALRVRGDSMIDELVGDGDIVVVQPTKSAASGDLVVALLTSGAWQHGGATLKRYYREAKRIRFQSANRTRKPSYARPEDVQIQGKVIALIRRL